MSTSRGEYEDRGRGENIGFRRTTANIPLSCSPSLEIPVFVAQNGKEENFAEEGLTNQRINLKVYVKKKMKASQSLREEDLGHLK